MFMIKLDDLLCSAKNGDVSDDDVSAVCTTTVTAKNGQTLSMPPLNIKLGKFHENTTKNINQIISLPPVGSNWKVGANTIEVVSSKLSIKFWDHDWIDGDDQVGALDFDTDGLSADKAALKAASETEAEFVNNPMAIAPAKYWLKTKVWWQDDTELLKIFGKHPVNEALMKQDAVATVESLKKFWLGVGGLENEPWPFAFMKKKSASAIRAILLAFFSDLGRCLVLTEPDIDCLYMPWSCVNAVAIAVARQRPDIFVQMCMSFLRFGEVLVLDAKGNLAEKLSASSEFLESLPATREDWKKQTSVKKEDGTPAFESPFDSEQFQYTLNGENFDVYVKLVQENLGNLWTADIRLLDWIVMGSLLSSVPYEIIFDEEEKFGISSSTLTMNNVSDLIEKILTTKNEGTTSSSGFATSITEAEVRDQMTQKGWAYCIWQFRNLDVDRHLVNGDVPQADFRIRDTTETGFQELVLGDFNLFVHTGSFLLDRVRKFHAKFGHQNEWGADWLLNGQYIVVTKLTGTRIINGETLVEIEYVSHGQSTKTKVFDKAGNQVPKPMPRITRWNLAKLDSQAIIRCFG